MSQSESDNRNQSKREIDFDDSTNSTIKKPRIENNVKAELLKKKDVVEIEADAAEDKGSRHSMEDAWVVMLDPPADSPPNLRCAHFAIYDGHGGRLAAEYAQKNLHANVVSAGLPRESLDVKAAKKAILDGFRKTDESLLQECASGGRQDGATAVCVWVLGRTVFVANIGDAKAVVARSSVADGSQNNLEGLSSLKAIVVTREHKAIYPQERARIQKADSVLILFEPLRIVLLGGCWPDTNSGPAECSHFLCHVNLIAVLRLYCLSNEAYLVFDLNFIERNYKEKIMAGGTVSSNGRLQGRLEVSRAFGDRQFKKFGVVATPDIHSFELTDREHFIILGCDGLWGVCLPLVFGPSDAVEFVQKSLKARMHFHFLFDIINNDIMEGLSVTAVSRRLVREAVIERRCKDNCTAIVIVFRHK
ncbi:hypothetical protein JRO89_XS13G0020900 [Xanthoceras sorbifolium]|uniref:PPM-type phosphatase domain-containing protein n=1 Tax=Xanthoceras sorbifolium TaxID=99658 RepID=A0ABQ8H657_9ROSI|nr:hypothetical protein JRO89_XS13G0020900 [Xanthoceras sorbifolium]